MASLNKITIIGHLGKDPEMRYLPSGEAVANVSVATSERWKDKQSGEMKEATEWHRVNFFGRLAEIAGEYLRKGSLVYVEGSIRTRSYEQNGVTKYSTEIRASEMKMLGGRDDGQQQQRAPAPAPRQAAPAPRAPAPSTGGGKSGFDDMDDDIPFRDPLSYRGVHLAL